MNVRHLSRLGAWSWWLTSLPAIVLAAGTVWAQPLAPVPTLKARVTDLTQTLTREQEAGLEQELQAFEARKGTQIVVLVVSSTKPEEIEQFAIRAVEQWKPGRKKIDDGALLLVAKDDRAMRIEVGYGLEGVLTDATSHRIISAVITPKFLAGDFYGGIHAGLASMMSVIDGEPLPEPARPLGESTQEDLRQYMPVILMLALVVGGVLRAVLGRMAGAGVAAGIVALLSWFFTGAVIVALIAGLVAFFTTLLGIGSRAGRWGAGSAGWGGGAGGFKGGGGFSGGGGGFGGGGASGRW